MKLLRQLTVRNLKLNRNRTIVTLIGIILSTAMICGVATLFASFQDLFIRSSQQSDGHYYAQLRDIPIDKIKYVTEHAETKTAMLTLEKGFALWAAAKKPDKPYVALHAFDQPALEHMPVRLKQGRFPKASDELIITEEMVNSTGGDLQIGDTLRLDIGTRIDQGLQLDSENAWQESEVFEPLEAKAYTITGIMHIPGFESWNAPGYSAITYLDEEILADSEQLDISILTHHPKRIFQAAPEMAEQVGTNAIHYQKELLRWMGVSQNDQVIRLFQSVGLIIIILIVVGSVTVIYNAFAISVSERKKQFGMLSSVGATGRQIRSMVFFEGLFLGLLAIPIGILSGITGIAVTLHFVNQLMDGDFFNFGLGLRVVVSPGTVLVTVFFVALTILLSAYIPAKRASQISPVEAIRLNADIQIKSKKLKTSWLSRRLFGIEGELALKNLKRNNRRYRATVFSLFISIVLYVSFSSFIHYAFQSTDLYYDDSGYDISVEKDEATLSEKNEFYKQVAIMEEVDQYAIVRSLYWKTHGLEQSELGNYLRKLVTSVSPSNADRWYYDLLIDEQGKHGLQVQVSSLNDESFAAYAKEQGLLWEDYAVSDQPRGILINSNKIDDPELTEYNPVAFEIGKQLTLQEFAYEENSEPKRFNIVVGALTEELPIGLTYTHVGGVHLLVRDQVLEEMIVNASENTQSEGASSKLLVQLKEKSSHQAFTDKIRAIDEAHPSAGTTYIWNKVSNREEAQQNKAIISIFLYGFISLITLIGITNILNTIHTNIALRRREFAMLKSVGLTPAGFNRMIRYESIFYGMNALLYGLPVSIVISFLLHRSFGNTFTFTFALPWREIGICIASVFVLVFFTMMQASRKLKRENIIDALKMDS